MTGKMKALAISLVCAAFVGTLAGCGGDNSSGAEGSKPDGAPSAGVKISLLNSKGGALVDPLEQMAKNYQQKTGVEIEIQNTPDGGSPFEKISSMYNSGNPPTIAMLDTTDVLTLANEKAVDLSSEKWVADGGDMVTKVDGKVYSFPLCVEGRGILYNKTVIENTLGESFDPSSIQNLTDFASICARLQEKGMQAPVMLTKEDWSLGAHFLQLVYETQGEGSSADIEAYLESLKSGAVALNDDPRYQEYINLLDTLMKYNYRQIVEGDPLGSDYQQDPIHFSEGDVAFWFNGNWAWADMKDYVDDSTEFGMMPAFIDSSDGDFANTSVQALGSKQLMIDKDKADSSQQQAAKDFLNWMVYEEDGQKAMVEELNLVPAFKNITLEPTDPLGISVKQFVDQGKTFAGAIVPGDHWKTLGISMQKYVGGKMDKAQLAQDIEGYWKEQAK